MEQLHDAAIYLINNYQIYTEMRAVENEIDNNYFVPILEKISQKLSSHKSFPKNWEVSTYSDQDDGEASINAYPVFWKAWNRHDDELGHVSFANLTLSEILADKRDERAWFALTIPLAYRQEEPSKVSANILKKLTTINMESLDGYEVDDDDKYSCCYKFIDRMPYHIITSQEKLIQYVVDNLLQLIKVVDDFNNTHGKELKKYKFTEG